MSQATRRVISFPFGSTQCMDCYLPAARLLSIFPTVRVWSIWSESNIARENLLLSSGLRQVAAADDIFIASSGLIAGKRKFGRIQKILVLSFAG
jgi:hypothetical protein